MPDDNTDAAAKLKKLGERVRDGWTKQHPMPEQSRETVRQTVREEWERDRKMARQKPARKSPAKSKGRGAKEPDQDR